MMLLTTPFFTSPKGVVSSIIYNDKNGAISFLYEELPVATGASPAVNAMWGTGASDVWAVGLQGAIWHRP
jgi:hypothetical protein